MLKTCKKLLGMALALALGAGALGALPGAAQDGSVSDVRIDYNFNTFDRTIMAEALGWATMAGNGFSFQDGKINIWGPNLDPTNGEKIPYEAMKYRLYINKQITPGNNAVSMGYNDLYDTQNDPEAGNTNTPYVVYENSEAFSVGQNVILQARMRCDLERSKLAVNISDSGGNRKFMDILQLMEDRGVYTSTEGGNWKKEWTCKWEQGTDYLFTLVFQIGSNEAKLFIDGALIAEGIKLFADDLTFSGINKVYFYADHTKETALDASKLFYVDDFKIASGDYIVGDIRYDSDAIVQSNTPCVPGKLTAGIDMTVVGTNVNMPVTLMAAEYGPDGSLVNVSMKGKTFTSADALSKEGVKENNGTLLDKMKLSCDLNVTGENSTIKLFAWDTVEIMKPLKETVELRNITNVYLASDSLVTDYREIDYPQAGWGTYLKNYFGNNVTLYNQAVGGSSTKTYYDTYWEGKIKNLLQPGDYVLLSFAHNDRMGINTDTCVDIDAYQDYLRKFIDETREKEGEPILVTGFNRGEETDTNVVEYQGAIYDYPEAMKEVAQEKNVVCLDLHDKILTYIAADKAENGSIEKTKQEIYLYKLVEQGVLTQEQVTNHTNNSLRTYGEDLTHLSENGAKKAAGWVVELLRASASPLKAYLTE